MVEDSTVCISKLTRGPAVDITPTGTVLARNFIVRQHGNMPLPQESIFAFVANCGMPGETYVVVGDPDTWLRMVGCARRGRLEIYDEWFDALTAVALEEANECGVEPPISITFANDSGVLAFHFDGGQT